jgi:hypothetical protein
MQRYYIIISSGKEVAAMDDYEEGLLRFLSSILEFTVLALTLWRLRKPKKPKKKKHKHKK